MLDALHVSVSVPQLPHATIRVAPGVHVPEHAPPMHWYGHVIEVTHWPLVLQVCAFWPEHCVAPGEQTPVHAPEAHTYWQATGLPHCPFAPHVSAELPMQRVAPGAQTPLQQALAPPSPQPPVLQT